MYGWVPDTDTKGGNLPSPATHQKLPSSLPLCHPSSIALLKFLSMEKVGTILRLLCVLYCCYLLGWRPYHPHPWDWHYPLALVSSQIPLPSCSRIPNWPYTRTFGLGELRHRAKIHRLGGTSCTFLEAWSIAGTELAFGWLPVVVLVVIPRFLLEIETLLTHRQ